MHLCRAISRLHSRWHTRAGAVLGPVLIADIPSPKNKGGCRSLHGDRRWRKVLGGAR